MKILFIGILLTLCSFHCSNTNAMDNLLKNMHTLATAGKIDPREIGVILDIKLKEDKEASARQGMKIYTLAGGALLSPYDSVELRIFDAGSRFFLLAYPAEPVPLQLEELKKAYTYKGFSAGDKRRDENPGYHFEKNGNTISFYCDHRLKQIMLITMEGNTR